MSIDATPHPATAPLLTAAPAARDVAEPARDAWRAELSELGGPSPLIHFIDAPTTRIELSTTHPGGLARFITGKSTLLSQLIRDDLALRSARIAAERITTRSLELATTRGIDAVHLGIGVVRWVYAGVEFCAPLLLRPLAIRRHGRDFELRLRGAAQLNPSLARALEAQYGISLDAESFVALSDEDGTFKPNAVIDQLRRLTGHLGEIVVQPRLVVSCFAEVAPDLIADAVDLAHPVLDALAGDATSRWALEEAFQPVDPVDPDRRDPSTDVLVLDADSEQEHIVAQIAAGNSLAVRTMPGTGATQTIVNALGALVGQNKRVLVVSPRRASLRGISQRLADVGLAGIAVTPSTLRRDVVRGIARAEKASQPQLTEVDEALVRLRSVLIDYREALSRPDDTLGVSVFDCVAELSRLALLPHPPSSSARLSASAVQRLSGNRNRAAHVMVEAARLGEFRYGPGDSPWYGAQFSSGEDALRAHAIAKRLHTETLPRLLVRANEVIGATRMRPYTSVAELGIYLRLLHDLRDTLDRFEPAVFDRSLSELIVATAPRRDAPEMSGVNRRRLRKLAKEYVRPGMHVGDLHEALTAIQSQRILWQRYVTAGVTPEVPTGVSDVQVAWQQVAADLAELDGPLGRTARETQLATLPLHQLAELLAELAADSDALHNLQERSTLMQELRDLDLDELITDLSARHVPEDRVEAELELAWWRSALDGLLAADRALLGAKTDVLQRLEADFRLVDEAHSQGSAALLAWQFAENWRIGIVDWPDEAAALKQLIIDARLTSESLQRLAPHLSRTVAPVWLASPYEVAQITDTMTIDTVILLDAGATTVAENVGAIRRSKQVIAFGDPVTQTPATFRIGLEAGEASPVAVAYPSPRAMPVRTEADADDALEADDDAQTDDATGPTLIEPPAPVTEPAEAAPVDLHGRSAFAQLAGVLPTLTLTRSYRAGGEDLAELVNRRFYGGRIDALPWAGSFLGHGSLSLDYIENGTGLPDPDTGAIESVDAEVSRVVELVVQHATSRPRESLMVVTASEKHAVRVMNAVLARTATHAELNAFVLGESAEPFTVLPVERAVAHSRDRVVFSLGYGRTPHGRVLSDFGPLGQPGGERLLAVAMTRARRSLVIVTCVKPGDLDEDRMKHGAVALAQLLGEIVSRRAEPPLPDDSDPMLVDLSRRLEARGLRVALGHRGKLGLVAANGGMCVVVDTDAVLTGRSLREALRLRPEVLRRLGWHYARVHSFELFADPDGVADRIARTVGLAGGPMTEEIPVVAARTV
ncbi:AAA family ATPase [Homoserinibacter sp. GY 40078]|uniref:AAA family ATPase n=1 Tax=Homoserinibacter sp. GY 40078 TaxID=2603275 RepID=UPI00210388C0|nr:AAA family ATPase [Homoserinibacter sp. GY 40078]